jgi:hypothetical protein
MFSIMHFLPTSTHTVGGTMPADRRIDGMDQIDVMLGDSAVGHRESQLRATRFTCLPDNFCKTVGIQSRTS